mgnify:CR=1 FL=1
MHHGRDKLLVQRGVTESAGKPFVAHLGVLGNGRLGILADVAQAVVAHLGIKGAAAVDLESNHEEWQRQRGKELNVVTFASNPGCQHDNQVAQDGAKNEAVEQDFPDHALRLILGDESVENEILLEI